MPFLPLFYRKWGITTDQIGFINCLRPLVSSCVSPMWGAFADATGRHNAILFSKMLVQAYGYALLSQVPRNFHSIFAYVVTLEAGGSLDTSDTLGALTWSLDTNLLALKLAAVVVRL